MFSVLLLAAALLESAQVSTVGQTVAPAGVSLSPGASIAVVLRRTVKAGKASPGDEVLAEITVPVLQNGRILIPEGARVFGRVTTAIAHTRDHPESVLAVRFERAEWKEGSVALNAFMVRALGRPEKLKRADPYNPTNCIPPMNSAGQPVRNPRFSCDKLRPRISDSGLPKLEDVSVRSLNDPMGPTELISMSKNVVLPKGLNIELRQVALDVR